MILIRQIVQQALTNGYLSVEAEDQLRQLLQTTKYGLEDINAFMKLQQAVIAGIVRQKSRELSAET
jgi:DNA-dependent RNA polymerase auxiliary subunit epsilon